MIQERQINQYNIQVLQLLRLNNGSYVSLDELVNQLDSSYTKMTANLNEYMKQKTAIKDYLTELTQWNLISSVNTGLRQLYKIELPGLCYLQHINA